VDKSPFSHLFVDEIFKAFPAAKFIHMVRDPRDNFAAIGVKFVQQHRSRVDFECLVWRYRVWACQSYYCALENQKKFGSDVYKIIRFEDLCLHPEKVIPAISTFLGIAHDECLYRPTIGSKPYPGNNWEGKVFAGISSENVNNWSLRIPEYYACLMECQPGGLLDRFDYTQCFGSLGHLKALSVHKLLTSVIPRRKLLLFHERLFQKPAADMLGV
jgi:hypothetical protein